MIWWRPRSEAERYEMRTSSGQSRNWSSTNKNRNYGDRIEEEQIQGNVNEIGAYAEDGGGEAAAKRTLLICLMYLNYVICGFELFVV